MINLRRLGLASILIVALAAAGCASTPVVKSTTDHWALSCKLTSNRPFISNSPSEDWWLESEGKSISLYPSVIILFHMPSGRIGYVYRMGQTFSWDTERFTIGPNHGEIIYLGDTTIPAFDNWRDRVLKQAGHVRGDFAFTIAGRAFRINNAEGVLFNYNHLEISVTKIENLSDAVHLMYWGQSPDHGPRWPQVKIKVEFKDWESDPEHWPAIQNATENR